MASLTRQIQTGPCRRIFLKRLTLGGAGLAILPSCAQEDLPQLTLEYREVRNPKNPKRYRGKYSPPAGKFKFQEIKHGGSMRNVHYYMPKRTAATSILLLLHGSNRNGPTMLDMWQDEAEKNGILLIAPSSQNPRNWSFNSDGIQFMKTAVSEISKANSMSAAPIYGFGHSAGATFMTHFSIRYGDYFKAAAVHAGAPSVATLESYYKYKKPRAQLTHFLGDKDHIFLVGNAKAAGEVQAAQGQHASLVVIKNHNHWYYDLAPFINKQAWAAMTKQQP